LVNDKSTLEIVESMINKFNFELDDPWKYDPFHVISNMKHVVGLQSYVNHLDAAKERLENKKSWIEVQIASKLDLGYTKERDFS
jgi:hypothetical protein